jgi:hypothetical protein
MGKPLYQGINSLNYITINEGRCIVRANRNLHCTVSPPLRCGSLATVASVIDHYSVTVRNISIPDEMTPETIYDGVASSSFIGKAEKMRRAYVEFVRKQVHNALSILLAASQIGYCWRLVFIYANYKSKHLATVLATELQAERCSRLQFGQMSDPVS